MNIEPNDEADLIVPEHERQLPALREPQAPSPTTAAQAKTDAIATLTLSAYQKASQLALSDEEVKALLADFPDDAFKPGAAGKEHLLYIEHAHLRDRLNSVFRPGQWAIVPRSRWAEQFRTKPSRDNTEGLEASRVYVEAMLCIRGCFAAEAVGEMEYYPHNAGQNYGDAVEGAKTAALRRCAKELGIGLQAWKKDWCDGWWARKRANSRPPVPPASPPKHQVTVKAQKVPPPQPAASQTPPAPSWTKRTPNEQKEHLARLEAWLGQCKTELLKRLEPVLGGVKEYAIKTGMIMGNELPNDIGLNKLFPSVNWDFTVEQNKPLVTKDFQALTKAVQTFMDGGEGPPEPEDDLPMGGTKPAADDEWWWDLIIPVPRKGMKRDEYLKHPDTIRSLYDQRHGDDEDAQIARERLFGFTNHYEPKGWVKKDGTKMPASDSDRKFREALDAFAEYVEKTGEKL